jgi:hypothetical protein
MNENMYKDNIVIIGNQALVNWLQVITPDKSVLVMNNEFFLLTIKIL